MRSKARRTRLNLWENFCGGRVDFDNAKLDKSRTAGNLALTMPIFTTHVLQGICLYSSRNPLWPSPALLVGAGGETKSTSWRKKWFLLCKRLTLKDKMHLLFWSCSRSRGKMGPSLGHSRCRRWGSPCRQSRCLRTYSCAFLHNVPPPEDPSVPIVQFFLTLFKARGQQVKARVHELCCRFRKFKRTFSEQKSQGNVDNMFVPLTMSWGPGPRNGQPWLGDQRHFGGTKESLQKSFTWFMQYLLFAVRGPKPISRTRPVALLRQSLQVIVGNGQWLIKSRKHPSPNALLVRGGIPYFKSSIM